MNTIPGVRWNLGAYLEKHNITTYKLMQATSLTSDTVYGLARGKHKAVALTTLETVLRGLESITGEPATITDLLVDVREPAPKQALKGSRPELLDSSLADLSDRLGTLEKTVPAKERKQWHERTSKAAKPAKYVPGRGVVNQ